MKTVTINERAAAMAMDFVVGVEARGDIEELYTLLDQVERAASADSYALGWMDGNHDGYDAGHHDGYTSGRRGIETTPYYEGDSGDETEVVLPDPSAGYGTVNFNLPNVKYDGRQPGETQFVRDTPF
jgi:hypothetical protein